MKIKDRGLYVILSKLFDRALSYLEKNPDEGLLVILNRMNKLTWGKEYIAYREFLNKMLNKPNNVWYKFISDLIKDVDHGILKPFLEILFLMQVILELKFKRKIEKSTVVIYLGQY